MPAIFEIMFGGRMGGEAGGRGGQTSQTKKTNIYIYIYICTVLAWFYMTLPKQLLIGFVFCIVLVWFSVTLLKQLLLGFVICVGFSMVFRDSAAATTDRVCNFYCFSMVLRDSAEATTDRVCNFYCFSKIRNLYAQSAHFDAVRRQEQILQPTRRHRDHR